ncbi:MAG: hypothetical protein ACKORG_04945 [Actinomycetota bacterium]
MDHQYHDPTSEADVQAEYARQEKLTRKVARGLLVFAIVWLPALLIVPEVFKTGAIASLALSTIAAVAVMIIVEHTWMKPRADERNRYGYRPPPPREYQAPVSRFLRDLRDQVQK